MRFFFKWCLHNLFHFAQAEKRQKLVWTKKILLLFILSSIQSLTLLSLPILFGFDILDWAFWALCILCLGMNYFLSPLFIALSVLILFPLDCLLKKQILKKAKNKLISNEKLIKIMIAGSYGKSTTKQTLVTLLSGTKKIQSTPGNINTDIGVAEWILNHLDEDTEICILESGEYAPGEIRTLADLIRPDIVIITGINEAHLERFGDLKSTQKTIFEAVDFFSAESTLYFHAEDQRVSSFVNELSYEYTAIPYYKNHCHDIHGEITSYHADGTGMNIALQYKEISQGEYKIGVLGDYHVGNIVLACALGKQLDIPHEILFKNVTSLQPVSHRLESIYNAQTDVLVIDDSYNGNPDGVREAISVLSKFTSRRKIYLTPGLVEMGSASESLHLKIGKDLANVADLVILIQNPSTEDILRGLESAGFPKSQIFKFRDATTAHASLGKIIKANDVILFQNDWSDNYT